MRKVFVFCLLFFLVRSFCGPTESAPGNRPRPLTPNRFPGTHGGVNADCKMVQRGLFSDELEQGGGGMATKLSGNFDGDTLEEPQRET